MYLAQQGGRVCQSGLLYRACSYKVGSCQSMLTAQQVLAGCSSSSCDRKHVAGTKPTWPALVHAQVVDLPWAQGPKEFAYDEEWLAVLCSTHSLLSLEARPVSLPGTSCG